MGEARRVYLHLGLQKTGTSYLQGVMRHNAEALVAQGLDLVPATRREAFELMLQVRERYDPQRDPASAADALQRFETELGAASGTRALVSQESLAAARPRQVRRLLAACADREVHVVLTVRDLARQLPSAWQQEVKAGKTQGFADFLERLQAAQRRGATSHPWIQLDAPAVLSRWAAELSVDRIHVVTVPPPGSPTTLLLERFCGVLGVDPDTLVPQERASNTSLGWVQVELLRRVNAELSDDMRRRQVYGDVGKRFFASQVLADQENERIRLPVGLRDWCEEVADQQIAALAAAGYDVVGDLEELRCAEGIFDDAPAGPGDADVADAAVEALGRILTMRGERVLAHRALRQTAGARLRRRLARLVRRGPEAYSPAEDHEP